MPQIDQLAATYASQFFWLILVFAILYFGIAKTMLGKVDQTVGVRQAKIEADLAAANAARLDASHAEVAYKAALSTAQAAAAKATAMAKLQANQATSAKLALVDQTLAEKLTQSEQQIRLVKEQAIAHIETIAADLAVDLVGKLTGTLVDGVLAQEAVTSYKKGIAHGH
jgi:F-type H+-transporting ATPase subunit b